MLLEQHTLQTAWLLLVSMSCVFCVGGGGGSMNGILYYNLRRLL
jgi:hypothetical protein